MRDLDQDAGAVAGERVGADGTAVLEVGEDLERVGDDLVRLAALEVGDEADAAGVVLMRRVIEALRLGGSKPVVGVDSLWSLGVFVILRPRCGTLQRVNHARLGRIAAPRTDRLIDPQSGLVKNA